MLVYLIGASGVGKDSLLVALRQQRPDLLVAHRYITRASGLGEDSLALSEAEFLARRGRGLFCLDWQAHGLHYGVGIEIECWLESGATVLLNGSRRALCQARERFGDQLLPVVVTAPGEVLRQRLVKRGRECPEQIEARLARHAEVEAELERDYPTVARLDNGGALAVSVGALEALVDTACR
ncbi:ribose 1,5-bisphosphokinase [Halomonas denitrificans]|uniref:ribose 1,5-bisphosphokinase n=1 Tax=Halomonas denitrificans TaxID=370769 RepID=UPI001CD3E05A|nr:ribose 1,5-bisphosphokinase [Halomonas denitrificans]MCA0976557.1 ribose 1,5-bisphosphokinase [Halomonas denitrificans]